jgi:DNA adenine methylase
MGYRGFGSFLAGQVVADLKYDSPLNRAPDWWTWAASGPGSRRGLNRVLGRPKSSPWDETEWLQSLQRLHEIIGPRIAAAGMPEIHMQDLQNCLCEWDKFERVRLGEGKPRSRYPGQAELPAASGPPHRETAAASPKRRRKTLKPALKWHGCKAYLALRILALMPPHVHYVEPFAGGLAVLLARDPADPRLFISSHRDHQGVSEVVNDLDGRLTTFWRVLHDEEMFVRFRRQIETVPVSRSEWEAAHEHEYGSDPVAGAVAFFINCRQSRQALGKDFLTHAKGRVRRGMNDHASAWLSAVEGLPAVHARLMRVVVENRPAVDVIRAHDSEGTLFYCDPPYLHETRTARTAYGDFEMTETEHRELLAVLRGCKGKVMLSGYPSRLYNETLIDWARHEFDIANHAAGGAKKDRETEVVWCNF